MSVDVRMKGFQKRARVEEALALIDARVRPLSTERVPFRGAVGRVLAQDIHVDYNVPAHPRSAMDGYAVRAADVPGTLTVIAELKAAEQLDREVGPGQAVRIMTGAKLPGGADAVIMVEDTKADGQSVVVSVGCEVGQHILHTGEDLKAGQPVLCAGRWLRPQDVSMLATVGALEITVMRRPRVRIVPSGTELIPVGRTPVGSEIVESNSFLLEALAVRDGADPSVHPIVTDDRALIAAAITAPGADVVVITGGSSVGQEDYAPVVVRELGELPIHGVSVKPGSPTGIGFVGDKIVVLAPGYPVAAFVAWDFFARPIVHRLLGVTPRWPYAQTRVRLAKDYGKPAGRVDIMRVILDSSGEGLPSASIIPGGASILSSVTRGDGFLLLPAGQDTFAAGAELDVHLYA